MLNRLFLGSIVVLFALGIPSLGESAQRAGQFPRGLRKITNGDEIIGLTRAFIYAGTPSILTTLWKVNDRSSYEVIRSYYANLQTMKKSDALRQAQLQTMKEFPQPFFWAAYTLTGEP